MPNKKQLSVLRKIARRFRDRNRRFQRLTIDQQRIKVLKDVISYLKSGKIIATKGKYLRLIGYRKTIQDDDQVHELIEQSVCRACGIGGLFMATVMLKNELKVSELNSPYGERAAREFKHGVDDYGMRRYMSSLFDEDQLALIEATFEEDDAFGPGYYDDNRRDIAVAFGKTFRTNKARFLAICENMLAHNGKFVPEDMKSTKKPEVQYDDATISE